MHHRQKVCLEREVVANLQGAQHVRLKQLLIGEGVVDQGAVVDDCVQALCQLAVDIWLQAQVGL